MRINLCRCPLLLYLHLDYFHKKAPPFILSVDENPRLSIRRTLRMEYTSSTILHSPKAKIVGLILTPTGNLQLP